MQTAMLELTDSLFYAKQGAGLPVRSGYLKLVDESWEMVGAAGAREEKATEPVDCISAELIDRIRQYLEFFLVAVCTHEAMHERQITTADELQRHALAIMEQVEQVSGLDVRQVVDAARPLFAQPEIPVNPVPQQVPIPKLVRDVKAILAACPIDLIEDCAIELGREEQGHRCRRTYWALEGFVRRNDPRRQESFKLIGSKYRAGLLTVEEAAILMGKHPSDVVLLLEAHGYRRSMDVIALSTEERAQRFEKIRADRLRREGKPEYVREQVVRDVLASERIEGVDARPWIRSKDQ